MIKKILLLFLLVVLALFSVLLFNTLRFSSVQLHEAALPAPEVTQKALTNFTGAINFKTISFGNASQFDSTRFLAFHDYLEKTYPLVHAQLKKEKVKRFSLLYTWEGKNPQLKPVILLAHQDVVPIEEGTEKTWTVDPFGGAVKDNFIWGRGTGDNKINLISIMETAEKLLSQNFKPEHTIYFAFGHDEEVGGNGAKAIAKLLQERKVQAELVLDEGGFITKERIPGMTRPVAMIFTAEKGFLSLDLSVEKNGGHSSMPEKETSIDILVKALVRLRENNFEAKFTQPMDDFIRFIGPEMPFIKKMIFANTWLFKGVLIGIYEKTGAGNAVVRTTLVPTIIDAGIKDNVVPRIATATINLRLLPGDGSSEITEQVKKIIDDKRINVKVRYNFLSEPSRVTDAHGSGFQRVAMITQRSYPDLLVTPLLMIGATDSRNFEDISANIIKFSPMVDPIGFHGIDERVSIESYKTSLWFYEQLIKGF